MYLSEDIFSSDLWISSVKTLDLVLVRKFKQYKATTYNYAPNFVLEKQKHNKISNCNLE